MQCNCSFWPGELRHILRDQILMLHRQNRQLQTHHAADLARPQAAGIHDMLGMHIAMIGDHIPAAIRRAPSDP